MENKEVFARRPLPIRPAICVSLNYEDDAELFDSTPYTSNVLSHAICSHNESCSKGQNDSHHGFDIAAHFELGFWILLVGPKFIVSIDCVEND